jgi:RNA polymerase sigma factor (sigma-70 family)
MKEMTTSGSPSAPEFIDLLATIPSRVSFADRLRSLTLSGPLEEKILFENSFPNGLCGQNRKTAVLTVDDEKELACEVLRQRHLFTEYLLTTQHFRQAVLTVVQNIYLFSNRKIFFSSQETSTENERREALLLFSSSTSSTSIPLAKTLQHLIIARVWNRILAQARREDLTDTHFLALAAVVEKLNTLRNIYVLLTTGLVKKLAAQINSLYKQSVTYEDAVQIGAIGIARAAYRYHPSRGVRFSTFAAHWVLREIQQQALSGRLLRISSNTIEALSKAGRNEDETKINKLKKIVESTTPVDGDRCEAFDVAVYCEQATHPPSPADNCEAGQRHHLLLQSIDHLLCRKSGDIIKRRYGLPPYQGKQQSIIAISREYQVTRSSIYQREQAALKKLKLHLQDHLL